MSNKKIATSVSDEDALKDVTIINVISGKGGTGKTCFTNVLADEIGSHHRHMVLVIDLDFPVRGTTELLGMTGAGNGELEMAKEGKSVTSFFKKYNDEVAAPLRKLPSQERTDQFETLRSAFGTPKLAISQLHSFYALTAVDWLEGGYIDYEAIFDWSDTDVSEALTALIKSALASSPLKNKQFDYIFLDNRAGYDRFVSGAYRISDFSILVQEEDRVSAVTAENLIEQLRTQQIRETRVINAQIIRVRNKVLTDHVIENPQSRLSTSDIPFDMDVMRLFGEPTFWREIRGTLYHKAVIKAWNCIDSKLSLDTPLRDVGPLGIAFKVASKMSIFPKLGRVLYLLGLMFTLSAFILLFSLVFSVLTPEMMESALGWPAKSLLLFFAVLGMLLMIISVFFIGEKRERLKVDSKRD